MSDEYPVQHSAHAWAFYHRRAKALEQPDSHILAYRCSKITPLYDSALESTRVYWRRRFGFSDAVAKDPRPLAIVSAETRDAQCLNT